MATEGAADVFLHRGIHLFTQPALIYGNIDIRQPRFLRRTLSYVGRPEAPAAALKPTGTTAPSGSATLVVRLGDVALAGENLPEQVTLVAVLCEAATTGRDFKPLRAAAVTLVSRDEASQPVGATTTTTAAAAAAAAAGAVSAPAVASANGAAAAANGSIANGDAAAAAGTGAPEASAVTHGSAGRWEHEPLLLPLPKRPLTRPALLLLASDWHPDMGALVPQGGRARRLRTELRSGGRLLGLLPELGPVWATIQPLEGVLGGGSGSGGAGALPSPSPSLRAHSRLQRGRLARSKCSVVGPTGATLSAMLLNLELDLAFDQDSAMAGSGMDSDPARAVEALDRARPGGEGAAGEPSENQPQGQPRTHKQAAPAGPGRPGVDRTGSRELGVAAPGTAVGGRLTRGSSGAGAGGGAGSLAEEEVQVVRLTSLAIGLDLKLGVIRQEAEQPPAPAEPSVVEFRFVYDASWCGTGAIAGAVAGTAAGSRRRQQQQQQREQQQRQQLLRAEQQLQERQRRGQQQQQRRSVDGGAGSVAPPIHGSADEGLVAPDGVEGAAGAGGEGGCLGGGGDRATWMKQQMGMAGRPEQGLEAGRQQQQQQQDQQGQVLSARQAKSQRERKRQSDSGDGSGGQRGAVTTGATAPPSAVATVTTGAVAAAAAAVPAGGGELTVTERYFTEEVPEAAGGRFRCPLCTTGLTCRGLQGLQQHLAASHNHYSYTFLEAEAEAEEGCNGGGSGAGGSGGGSGEGEGGGGAGGAERQRRHVVEVRLPPEAVDPARHDLALPCEDVLLFSSDQSVALRAWIYSRAAGMDGPVHTDAAAVESLAGRQGLGNQPWQLLPLSPLPPGRIAGRGRRGGARAGGRGTAAVQRQQRAAQQQQPPAGRSGGGGGGGGRAGATTLVRVSLESLRKSAAGATLPPSEGAAAGAAAGAAGAAAGPAGPAAAPPLPPSALASGVHPPGRRYFHCRTAVPATIEELFGAYDSDDETDDEEWEAAFDRHMAQSTRITPLRPADRRFFKLWSAFARRRPIYADYITRSRCLEFSRQHGELLRSEPELRAAMVVHLLLLHEMNLIDPRVMQRCLLIVDGRITSTAEEDEQFLATRGSEVGSRAAVTAAAAAIAGAGAADGGAGGGGASRGDDDEGGGAAGGGAADGSCRGDADELGGSGSGDEGSGDEGEGDGGGEGNGGGGGEGGRDGYGARDELGGDSEGGGGKPEQRRARQVRAGEQEAAPRRRHVDGTEEAPEGKRRRRAPSTASGEPAGGDAANTAAGGTGWGRRSAEPAAAAAAASAKAIQQGSERGRAEASTAAARTAVAAAVDVAAVPGGQGRREGGGDAWRSDAPAGGPRPPPPPASAGSSPGEAESPGGVVAGPSAAVETGTVEAEGGVLSPARAAAAPLAQRGGPAAGAPPPPPAQTPVPQQLRLEAPSLREMDDPQALPPPASRQGQQQQSVSSGRDQPQPSSRPSPALSWSLNKKASRALAAPAVLQQQQMPRPLPVLQGRAAVPAAAAAVGAAAPAAAAAATGAAMAGRDAAAANVAAQGPPVAR